MRPSSCCLRREEGRLQASGMTGELKGAGWGNLPCDLLVSLLHLLDLESRVAAASACTSWRAVAQRPGLWLDLEFATRREGSRRTELRRLLSLAAWASRHAGETRSLIISARLPPDSQPAGLKAVSQAALAAVASLQVLSLTANRGFWLPWLPRLARLHSLRLCSKEGGLSLHGDLQPLVQLTSLVLEARHGVTLSDTVRLPTSIVSVELSCIRDTLPPQLSQLSGLQRLAVRRGLVSEGILLTEYEALAHLTGLTSLALEQQEEDAWLPPPELLLLTGLRHLSISGNDCSRWPLHGSDEAFSAMLCRMAAHLTSLDISGCGLEDLPAALLHTAGPGGGASDDEEEEDGLSLSSGGGGGGSGSEEGSMGGPAAAQLASAAAAGSGMQQPLAGASGGAAGAGAAARRGPCLRRLLAHGNQLEASAMHGDPPELLWFPSCVRQLSVDWHVLVQLPITRLPPRCRTLALIGRDGAMRGMLSALAGLPPLLPNLRHLLLEPAALDALWEQQRGAAGGGAGGSGSGWQVVAGRWRPPRLPGQPKQQAPPDVLQRLKEGGVEVAELLQPEQLPAVLDEMQGGQQGRQYWGQQQGELAQQQAGGKR